MLSAQEIAKKSPDELANILAKMDAQQAAYKEQLHAQQATYQEQLHAQEATIIDQEKKLQHYLETIETLRYQKNLLLQQRYGRKSEQIDESQAKQLAMCFDEAEEEQTGESSTEEASTDDTVTVPAHQRKKRGRKSLSKDLPRIQVDHDLEDDNKQCECGCALTPIGVETSEQIDMIPAQVYVIEHRRHQYACKACEAGVRTAPYEKQHPIPKSIASPGLLSHLLVSKYKDHLPLYRQEAIFQRIGIDISRKTLSNWVIQIGELFKPLVKLMHDEIESYDIAYADETPVQVLKEVDRPATSKSYMWVFMGGPPDQFSKIYHYAPTRSSTVPSSYLEDFKGILHCDGYASYQTMADNRLDEIKLSACWAHVRRKFIEVTKGTKKSGLAHEAVKQIAELYKLEKQARQKGYDANTRYRLRQKKAKPIVEKFEKWCKTHASQVLPQSPIATAIHYAVNRMEALKVYLSDGRLEIDNNRTERAIKPFVLGRKNWLFMGNEKGAEASANIYSLMETCAHHGVNVYSYFKYVLTHIREATTMDDLEKLLPYHVKTADLAAQYMTPEQSTIVPQSQILAES